MTAPTDKTNSYRLGDGQTKHNTIHAHSRTRTRKRSARLPWCYCTCVQIILTKIGLAGCLPRLPCTYACKRGASSETNQLTTVAVYRLTSRSSRRDMSHTLVLSHKSFGRNSLLILPSAYHSVDCGQRVGGDGTKKSREKSGER